MAISGAAVSAIMGSITVGPLTSLMALLNLRLAYWLPNPKRIAELDGTAVPSPGPSCFVKEMMRRVDERSDYVHLSDGGHHENLGAIELFRRRCSLIIIGDAEADPEHKFRGLRRLLELVEQESIAAVEIDEKPLHLDADRRCKEHFVVGTIKYYKRGQWDGEEEGKLVYIKSSRTGDEGFLIDTYSQASRFFPHEPTTQQFYADNQFECYRKLGLHIGRTMIAKTSDDLSLPLLNEQFRRRQSQLTIKLSRVQNDIRQLDGFQLSDHETAYIAFDHACTGHGWLFFKNWMVLLDGTRTAEKCHLARVLRLLAIDFLDPEEAEVFLRKIATFLGEVP
jgi:hypothetical protein